MLTRQVITLATLLLAPASVVLSTDVARYDFSQSEIRGLNQARGRGTQGQTQQAHAQGKSVNNCQCPQCQRLRTPPQGQQVQLGHGGGLGKCYSSNRYRDPDGIPCFGGDNASRCCGVDEFCSTNKLCVSKSDPNKFSRGSCVDFTFRAASCPSVCRGVKDTGAVLPCGDRSLGNFCCDEGQGSACCSKRSKVFTLGKGTTFTNNSPKARATACSNSKLNGTSQSKTTRTATTTTTQTHCQISSATQTAVRTSAAISVKIVTATKSTVFTSAISSSRIDSAKSSTSVLPIAISPKRPCKTPEATRSTSTSAFQSSSSQPSLSSTSVVPIIISPKRPCKTPEATRSTSTSAFQISSSQPSLSSIFSRTNTQPSSASSTLSESSAPDKNIPMTTSAISRTNTQSSPASSTLSESPAPDKNISMTTSATNYQNSAQAERDSQANSSVIQNSFTMMLGNTNMIGIIIGVGAFVSLLSIGIVIFCIRRRKRSRDAKELGQAQDGTRRGSESARGINEQTGGGGGSGEEDARMGVFVAVSGKLRGLKEKAHIIRENDDDRASREFDGALGGGAYLEGGTMGMEGSSVDGREGLLERGGGMGVWDAKDTSPSMTLPFSPTFTAPRTPPSIPSIFIPPLRILKSRESHNSQRSFDSAISGSCYSRATMEGTLQIPMRFDMPVQYRSSPLGSEETYRNFSREQEQGLGLGLGLK
ncbi:hypothetical protein DSL72_002482 [Monilinia vaccinii-corymbosi]|uniref:Mid2 domain-containing protein n=1 Tax=Monilinia vaccinii-corymbosi TaxID=61207 RepID=A0A8A3PCU5_9HELO|nr:hypothetical protein DSL72_002482 [Monilinia vaccinii-corymbosi]